MRHANVVTATAMPLALLWEPLIPAASSANSPKYIAFPAAFPKTIYTTPKMHTAKNFGFFNRYFSYRVSIRHQDQRFSYVVELSSIFRDRLFGAIDDISGNIEAKLNKNKCTSNCSCSPTEPKQKSNANTLRSTHQSRGSSEYASSCLHQLFAEREESAKPYQQHD